MSSKRPVSPGAEEILGLYFPVLDHGFVALVDYMGTDECIERAARVSYGYGTRKASLTRGLLRYLRRHLHTTPSEMLELKFHCCMPMFIARQWIRHRSACLAGDAHLMFDLPGGARRGKRHHYAVPIADFHRRWHHGTEHPFAKKKPAYLERLDMGRDYTIPELASLVDRREETLRNYVRDGVLAARRTTASDPRLPAIFVSGAAWRDFATREHTAKVDMRPGLREMKLRSCNEETGEIIHTRVVDIWESGVKPVFRVTLQNGRKLKMSKDHRCLTREGWLTLEQATGLRVGKGNAVAWRGDAPEFAVNGVPAYQDEGWLRARRAEGLDIQTIADRAGISYRSIRKYLKKFGLQFTAKEKATLSGLRQRGTRRTFAKPRKTTEAWRASVQRARSKLVRSFSAIAKIELVGEEMTYDLEVEGPFHNFVADGFIVHNSVNEYSGRYSLMPMLFYTPSAEHLQTQSRANNQGRSGTPVSAEQYADAVGRWNEIRQRSRDAYEHMTSNDFARELARIDLPLSTYTQWYWKIDLHNFLHFLKLRVDHHAQWEIQEYGRVMAGMLKRVAPISYEAWIDYDVCGARVSRMDLDALRELVRVEEGGLVATGGKLSPTDLERLGLAKREIADLLQKLQPKTPPDFELDLAQAKNAEWFAEEFQKAVPTSDKPPE